MKASEWQSQKLSDSEVVQTCGPEFGQRGRKSIGLKHQPAGPQFIYPGAELRGSIGPDQRSMCAHAYYEIAMRSELQFRTEAVALFSAAAIR
ncbi:hypothetical protein CVM73_18215 [Bradyrhizobium forestalis]|uniref:Uncharacterized protein n=1 Tax=Bradyrhizobium forestalis TaxID=1419263 RepID=A0A2M8R792_9BRAD|nr:hypothetical protein CVM73_18215 [Bradyrhizobium forestalis]